MSRSSLTFILGGILGLSGCVEDKSSDAPDPRVADSPGDEGTPRVERGQETGGAVSTNNDPSPDRPSHPVLEGVHPSLAEAVRCYGLGGEPNKNKARLLFLEAEKAGDALAGMWIARLYHKGRCGFPQDSQVAEAKAKHVISYVSRLAREGNVYAQFLWASALHDGLGVTADLPRAETWYGKAVEGGDILALTKLAGILRGRDTPEGDVRAVELFRKGVKAGSATAMNDLGFMYESGRGNLAVDYAEAARLYQRAAEMQHALAMTNLGYLYDVGRIGPGGGKGEEIAVTWYGKAADLREPRAMANLGVKYASGRGGLPVDRQKAEDLYRRAIAIAGDVLALNNLGLLLVESKEPSADTEACQLFRAAVEKGYPRAFDNLGRCYELGVGSFQRSSEEAERLYRQAAARDVPNGMNNLGLALSKRGEYREAVRWFWKAANEHNHTLAWRNLGVAHLRGLGVEKNLVSAVDYFRRAARLGDIQSQRWLQDEGHTW